MTSFRIAIADSDLADLRARLAATRWPDAETVDDWSQGVPLDYLRELSSYWADGYDWRATESRLNGLEHFRTDLDGTAVHFVHARSPHADALPLLVTHGWPGTFAEFEDVIAPLTRPESGDPADAFHVVCPSLPGFGFSARPDRPGHTVERIAGLWERLMRRLGYPRYGAHGGDFGSFITAHLGSIAPQGLVGIHITMPFATAPRQQVELSDRDYAGLAALKEFGRTETGYSAIQSTKPQTLGYGLADCPAGQLAWIAEKYWSWSGHDGDLEKAVPRDRLLDAASIYWLTNTAASSARLYWESHNKAAMLPVEIPTGCSLFPGDARMPRPWCEGRFRDLRMWHDLESGGHFPAVECPDVLVGELREFFRPLR
ncbi:MAG: epoxide hydrolase family protein [Actinocrinis sp.]